MGKLIKVDSSLTIMNSADMNEYLKPMSRDILLFSSKISGTYKLKDKTPLLKLTIGEKLFFKHVESKYESSLISISNKNNELVGYIPEVDSLIFSRLMDAGKMLFGVVKSISHSTSTPIYDIDIFLKDF